MRKWLARLILVFSVVLFSISLYFLMGMFLQERQERQTYQKLQEIMEAEENENTGNEQESGSDGNESAANTGATVNAGLLALHGENPDCIAWIQIEGTAVDYPVMYRPQEKNYYLHRDFYGNYAASGTLYLSEICDPETSDNQIIYGHHMNSGTMFAALDQYKSREFYEEHPIITYRTLHGDEEYEIIAAFALPVGTGTDFSYYAFSDAESAAEYGAYVSECKERSYYDTGKTAEYGERLLTLSTCEYSHKNGRMVVVAKLLRKGGG